MNKKTSKQESAPETTGQPLSEIERQDRAIAALPANFGLGVPKACLCINMCTPRAMPASQKHKGTIARQDTKPVHDQIS